MATFLSCTLIYSLVALNKEIIPPQTGDNSPVMILLYTSDSANQYEAVLKANIRNNLMGNCITGQFGITGKMQFFHDPAPVCADGC